MKKSNLRKKINKKVSQIASRYADIEQMPDAAQDFDDCYSDDDFFSKINNLKY